MKLSIIGASGSIGQEIIRMFLSNTFPQISNLSLFYHSNKGKSKLLGLLYDSLVGNSVNQINVTSSPNSLVDTDICIICAGAAVDTSIENITNKNTVLENNREMLYEENKEIVLYWCKEIQVYSPFALVIVVTNPVSKLLVDIYNNYTSIKAIGCGITNDTLRVRNEFMKLYGDNNLNNLFLIGEHNLNCQTVALSYYNISSNSKLDRSLFEKSFSSNIEKKCYIAKLKDIQNELIINNRIEDTIYLNNTLPLVYKSYMTHRMSHFLFKTHLSTSMAIKEIIEAYIYEDKIVSVETKSKNNHFFNNSILGIPIKFKDKDIIICDIPFENYERNILLECEKKFKLY